MRDHDTQEDHGAELGGDSTETLARVRDLLFGEAQRSQARRADEVESRFTAALGELDRRLQEAMGEAARSTAAEFAALRERLDALEHRVERIEASKVERGSLAEQLRALAGQLSPEDAGHGGFGSDDSRWNQGEA